jgi:hypothetical protein
MSWLPIGLGEAATNNTEGKAISAEDAKRMIKPGVS